MLSFKLTVTQKQSHASVTPLIKEEEDDEEEFYGGTSNYLGVEQYIWIFI